MKFNEEKSFHIEKNLQSVYNFMDKPEFKRMNKSVENGFSNDDLEQINILIMIDKNLFIAQFHNFFSEYKEDSATMIAKALLKENLKPKERMALEAFQKLAEHLSWSNCRNIVNFVENISRPNDW